MNRAAMRLMVVFLSIMVPSVVCAHSLSLEVKDKYLISKGITVYEGPVIQTNLTIDLPKGFYLGLFGSKSADSSDFTGNFGNEVDYTVGWSGIVRNLRLDFGVSYLDLAKVFSTKGGDAVQMYGEVGRDIILNGHNTLTLYMRTEMHIPVGKWQGNAHAGAYVFMGVKNQWRVHKYMALNQKLAVMYDTGTFVASDRGFLGHYDLDVSWNLTKALSMSLPTFKLIFPISSLNDGRGVEHMVGGGLNFKF